MSGASAQAKGLWQLTPTQAIDFEPSSVRLERLAERPMSPVAGELRSQIAKELLLDSTGPEFPSQLINCFRRHGFAVVYDSSVTTDVFRNSYDVMRRLFAEGSEYLSQLGRPGPGKEDGYIPAEVEVSTSSTGGLQANVFEFIHRTSSGNNVEIGDSLGEELKSITAHLLSALYYRANHVARAMAIGLGAEGFLTPKGEPLPEDYFVDLMHSLTGERSNLSLLRLTHCNAKKVESDNYAGCSQAHTDLNFFTVLPAATKEGLQIWYEDLNAGVNSGWVQLDAPHGAFVVNMADQGEILTRGFLRSTPHRVVAPLGEDRYSIILFAGLMGDVELIASTLTHPHISNTSRYQLETLPRLGGHTLTAQLFTDLRKGDINLISAETIRSLGLVPLNDLVYRQST